MSKPRQKKWLGTGSEIGIAAQKNNKEHLETYSSSPTRIDEDVQNEKSIYQGGYTNRQIFELIQNAADAARLSGESGRIELRLTDEGVLYCANSGEPLSEDGLTALQFTRLSPKAKQDVDLIGRFGVGFKSMLAVTDSLTVYSRSGSVLFDRKIAEKEIRLVVPDCEETPRMRFAFPFDPREDFLGDAYLAEVADWADTIIKAKIQKKNMKSIRKLLESFPAEFLLFVEHIESISIFWPQGTREIKKRKRNEIVTLVENKDGSALIGDDAPSGRWRVFQSEFEVSLDAKQDAPRGHNDELPIPISWAVPLESTPRNGQIWSFFPTDVEISLSGILNAPWRTSEDRTSVAQGEYNSELIQHAAGLIAESLPTVVDGLPEPGVIVDLLNEPDDDYQLGWIEEELAVAVYESCAYAEAFADGAGELRTPDQLTCWGEDGGSRFEYENNSPHKKTGELWAKGTKIPDGWAHWTFFPARRAQRLKTLRDHLHPYRMPWNQDAEWFSDLVEEGEPSSSVHAIQVLDDYERRNTEGHLGKNPEETDARGAEIIMVRDGSFVSAFDAESLRLEGPKEDKGLDTVVIHPTIVADKRCQKYLLSIGVRKDIDVVDRVKLLLRKGRLNDSDTWDEIWSLINIDSFEAVADYLKSSIGNDVWLRCMDGEFHPNEEVLWPGAIVAEDGSGGKRATIDHKFHRNHKDILFKKFHVGSEPQLLPNETFTGGFDDWWSAYLWEKKHTAQRFMQQEVGSEPRYHSLEFYWPSQFVQPLGVLQYLLPEAAERFTRKVIELNPTPAPSTVEHITQAKYPRVRLGSPEAYMISKYGYYNTTLGSMPTQLAIRIPIDSSSERMIPLELFDFLPVITEEITLSDKIDKADFQNTYRVNSSISPKHMDSALRWGIPEKEINALLALAFYSNLSEDLRDDTYWDWSLSSPVFGYSDKSLITGYGEHFVSEDFTCKCGLEEGDPCKKCNTEMAWRHRLDVNELCYFKMYVTAFPELNDDRGINDEDGVLVLPLRHKSLADWLHYPHYNIYSLDNHEDFGDVEIEIEYTAESEPKDVFWFLKPLFEEYSLIPEGTIEFCDSLQIGITQGSLAATRECFVWRDEKGTWYVHVDDSRIDEVAEAFQRELWFHTGVILESEGLKDLLLNTWESEELRKRKESTLACTTDEEKLVALLGRSNILQDRELSHIIAAFSDPEEIENYDLGRILISKYGIAALKANRKYLPADAPQQFAGNPKARNFVSSVGLSPAYAGMPAVQRPEIEHVDGPTILPPLHPYQEKIVERINSLIAGEDEKTRGLISLPTGSGKTRVTVQGLISSSATEDIWPVMWVAQSDELCEQAAVTWKKVWRAEGGENQTLTVSRLWGKNEFNLDVDGPHVVIATNQKLHAIQGRVKKQFSFQPSVVVIDEAHHSIAPTYTEIVNTFIADTKIPLLGLTATPFRGVNEPTTRWLTNRYEKNRLDQGILGKDPLETLREKGVLAGANHQIINTDHPLELTMDEQRHWQTFQALPPAVENKLAMDPKRTKTVVETALGLPKDWQIMIFCPSVAGAELIASQLSLHGETAQSISAQTPSDARRHAVEQYNRSKIRFLTNYSVLSEGFDAPSTRAIVISRPIFSPNVYQQVIGRGLRGPKNGGKENCTIIDVSDNYEQFGGQLAFTHFEYLWSD